MTNKNLKAVDPKQRVQLYATADHSQYVEGQEFMVSVLLKDKLVNSGKATLKPVAKKVVDTIPPVK